MRKSLPAILSVLLSAILIPACEVENCPPNALSFAHFTFVDQYGRSVVYTDTLSVYGQTDYGDSVVQDTLVNREMNVSELSLPVHRRVSSCATTAGHRMSSPSPTATFLIS